VIALLDELPRQDISAEHEEDADREGAVEKDGERSGPKPRFELEPLAYDPLSDRSAVPKVVAEVGEEREEEMSRYDIQRGQSA
jgi:hypothetical protein